MGPEDWTGFGAEEPKSSDETTVEREGILYTSYVFHVSYLPETSSTPGMTEAAGEPTEEVTEKPAEGATEEITEETTEGVTEADREEITEDLAEEAVPGERSRLMRRAGETGEVTAIEKFSVQLVSGAAKNEKGDLVWTPERSSGGHRFIFRVNFSLSGTGDLPEEAIAIRIPRHLLRDKSGDWADSYEMSVPLKDDSSDETDPASQYAYREEGEDILFYNCASVPGAVQGYFEVAYAMTEPTFRYADYGSQSEGAEGGYRPFAASIAVSGLRENSQSLPVAIDTFARITSVQKGYPALYREWQASWGQAPADAGDYFYLKWEIASSIRATQAYDFALEDTPSSAEGAVEVVGYDMAGDGSQALVPATNSAPEGTSSGTEAGASEGAAAQSLPGTARGAEVSGSRYDYVVTRHAKKNFDALGAYTITNRVRATVTPSDGVDGATSASSSRTFQWTAPKFTAPLSRFNIFKWGDDNWHERYTSYRDYSRYDLNTLQDGEADSLEGLNYIVECIGYPYPLTLGKGEMMYDPSGYGKRPVGYEVTDDTLYLLDGRGKPLAEGEEGSAPLGAGDYELQRLGYTVLLNKAVYNDEKAAFDPASQPFTDQDILTLSVRLAGETAWRQAARINLSNPAASDILLADAVDGIGVGEVVFKNGVQGYKLEIANACYSTIIRSAPYVRLKGSDRVRKLIAGQDVVTLKNEAHMTVYEDADNDQTPESVIYVDTRAASDRLRRTIKTSAYGMSAAKARNDIRKKQYTVTWRLDQQERLLSGTGQSDEVRQTSGVFYTLLPRGMSYVRGSVRVQDGSVSLPESGYEVETVPDHQGSGRTLVAVRLKTETKRPLVYLDGAISWDSLKDYGTNLHISSAYETGNTDIAGGYADDGGSLSPGEKDWMAGLDPLGGGARFLYAETDHEVSILTASISGLSKKVMGEKGEGWSYSDLVSPGGRYQYLLRFENTYLATAKNMIFFDSLENFSPSPGRTGDWHGTLRRIDVSQLEARGIAPAVYISEREDLDIADHRELSDSAVWTRVTQETDLSAARAIAIDMGKRQDDSDFTLEEGGSVAVTLTMEAPETAVEKEEKTYPAAWNNVFLQEITGTAGGEEPVLIHQDYTTVLWHVTSGFTLKKVSAEDENTVIPGITFRLQGVSDYGRAVDQSLTTDREGRLRFADIEKGTYHLYEAEGTADWLIDHTEHQVVIDGAGKVSIDGVKDETGALLDYRAQEFVVANEPRIHADVEFDKKDLTIPARGLSGARFRLSGTSDYGNDILMYASSDEQGAVRFADLELGTYELRELEAPEGFITDPEVYTVTVDENGNFAVGREYVRTSETITRYSHTPNIADDGTQKESYANSLRTNEVIRIPGASSLKVTITWGGESASFDYVCAWAGEHPEYTAYDNYRTSLTGRLGGGSHTASGNTSTYKIDGDAVTFAFKSDSSGSGDGYGYYAVVTGEVVTESGGPLERDRQGRYRFCNEPFHAFRLVKKSAYDGSPVPGASFRLTGTSDYGTKVDMSAVSSPNGFVDFAGLEAGTYLLQETAAPEGFRRDETTRAVTITRQGETAISGLARNVYGNYDVYNAKMATDTITVIKIWEDDKKPEERTLPTLRLSGDKPVITYEGEATLDKAKLRGALNAAPMRGAKEFGRDDKDTTATRFLLNHPGAVKIDDGRTAKSIYLYLDDDGNCRWWTDAEKAYLPEDSSDLFSRADANFGNEFAPTAVDLTGFDASRTTTMKGMFRNCAKLTSLNLTGLDTSSVRDMSGMFDSCYELTSLDVSGFDTSNVTDMSRMFSRCYELTSLDVSNFNTAKVTDMKYMFDFCYKLASLDVSGFDTSNVTNMYGMFAHCELLKSLDVPNFNTAKVKNMGNMFGSCKSLTSLDLSNFDTSNVLYMDWMFSGCTWLKSLDLSGWDTSKVINMGNMFHYSRKLSAIYVSDTWSADQADGNVMFGYCESLPNYNAARVDQTCAHTGVGGYLTYKARAAKPASIEEGSAEKTTSPEGPAAQTSPETKEEGKGEEAAGTGKQSYTSVTANVYDPSAYAPAADMTDEERAAREEQGRQALAALQAQASREKTGYWTRVDENTDMYTFYVDSSGDTDWYVWEDEVEGYVGDHDVLEPAIIRKEDADKTATITNTRKASYLQGYGSLRLTKSVVGENGADIADGGLFDFTVELKDEKGKALSGRAVYGGTAFADGRARVSLGDGGSVTFTGIPAGYTYTVTEIQAAGYVSAIDKPSGRVAKDAEVTVSAVNTKKEPEIPEPEVRTVDLTVAKEVTGRFESDGAAYGFYASLSGLKAGGTYRAQIGEADELTFTADGSGGADIAFSLKAGQRAVFSAIPENAVYRITEKGGDYRSSYAVTDDNGLGKIIRSAGENRKTDTPLSTELERADAGEAVTVTFTNELMRTQDIRLTKSVLLGKGGEEQTESGAYVFEAVFTDLPAGYSFRSSVGGFTADDEGQADAVFSLGAGEEVSFTGVPVGARYQFTERRNDCVAACEITDENGLGKIEQPEGTGAFWKGENQAADRELSTPWQTVNEGEEATAAFTNIIPATYLVLRKMDRADKTKLLPGAQYGLYDDDKEKGTLIRTIDIGDTGISEPVLLKTGKYYLKETKAPEGYWLDIQGIYEVEVTKVREETTITLDVYDDRITPVDTGIRDGGRGAARAALTEIALGMTALLGAFGLYRRRRRSR